MATLNLIRRRAARHAPADGPPKLRERRGVWVYQLTEALS